MNADELKLWQDLDAARGTERYSEIRNQLVDLHYVLVTAIARKTAARLRTKRVDVAELQSAGFDGLIGAIESFDVNRGTKFRTYAARRVFGAIVDWQRSIDPNVRHFYRQQKAIEGLVQKLGRRVNEYEILEHLAIGNHQNRHPQSIDVTRSYSDGYREETLRDSIKSRSEQGSLSDLSPMLRGLSQSERLMVLLYVIEECTMKQIGKELGISESRVSQCMSKILPRLRESYERAAA